MINGNRIQIKNIYYMIAYAFRSLSIDGLDDNGKESFENIYNLFAAIISQGISRQLKRGLYREYTGHRDNLSVMRGKLDMNGTIRNRISRRQMLMCDYDELSENNLMNRILKTTVLLLIRVPDVNPLYKDILKKQIMFFAEVELTELSAVNWNELRYSRNSYSYRILMGVCQLIAECMIITTENGELKTASFIDDQHISMLYERFILEYYRKHFPGLSVSNATIPWSLGNSNDDSLLPEMRSDIMLGKGNSILVIDACYNVKIISSERNRSTLDSGDVYQIFTYVKNLEYELSDIEHTVSGMILYARTSEPVQPENDYNMQGNRISVRTLDLDSEFGAVAEQLDSIAYEYFGEKPVNKMK